MFVSNAVQVSANLSREAVVYKLCPPNEFSHGTWNVAIGDISYDTNASSNVLCCISCNLVQAQKFSETNQVISYEQPLVSFLLKASTKSVYRFGEVHQVIQY